MANDILKFETNCPIFLEKGDAKITTPFGKSIPDYPTEGKTGSHYGLDLVRNIGYNTTATILAFEAGVVKEVRKNVEGIDRTKHTAGNYVKIEHENGYATRYLHLKYNSIPDNIVVGAKVAKGDKIGFMGNTGDSYGAHLHFEVWKNEERIDPTPYLLKNSFVEEQKSVIEYTIQKGDSLSKIAKKYNTTVAELVEINNIKDPDKINAGKVILIPVAAGPVIKPEPEPKPEEVPTKEAYPGTASTGSDEDAKVMWDYMLEKIGNEYGVAGLMGNIQAESNLRSNNLENSYEKKETINMNDEEYTTAVDNGTYTNFIQDHAGYGLAQWTYWSRKEWLYNYSQDCKKSICDYQMQLEFLWKELSRDFKKVVNTLKTATSVREASDAVLLGFEKPKNQGEEYQEKRAAMGQTFYDKFHLVIEETPVIKQEEKPIVEDILDLGTVILLKDDAKMTNGSSIFFLFHLFKFYIKQHRVENDQLIYTIGIFKDFSFFDFDITAENFIVVS